MKDKHSEIIEHTWEVVARQQDQQAQDQPELE